MKYSDLIPDEPREQSVLVPRTAGFEHCRSKHSFGPYIRDIFLLHYCVSGKGVFEIGGKKYPVSAGEIFLIPPHVVTTYTADESDPWHYIWIGFDGNAAERLREVSPVVRYEADTFLRIAESVEQEIRSPERYISYIYEIFYHLFSDKSGSAQLCVRIKNYIRLNYMRPLTVEGLADDAGLDRRYFSRLFKKTYGVSLKEYLTEVRMSKACELLMSGYSIAECAAMVGYDDPFNFSKMFRKQKGISPSVYRRKLGDSIEKSAE